MTLDFSHLCKEK